MNGFALHIPAPGRVELVPFSDGSPLPDDCIEGPALASAVSQGTELACAYSKQDPYRSFEVQAKGAHPLVAGLPACTIEDELYWRQHGPEPLEPLLVATSEQTGVEEPLAWAYEVGNARVVQSLLGHSAKTYDAGAMRAFARRAVAWCAGRAIHGTADGP